MSIPAAAAAEANDATTVRHLPAKAHHDEELGAVGGAAAAVGAAALFAAPSHEVLLNKACLLYTSDAADE